MPLLVRNAKRTKTLLPIHGQPSLVWEPNGDPNGGDVIQVPDDVGTNIDFMNAVQRGTFVIEDADDPEMLERIQKRINYTKDRQAQAQAETEASIDRRQERDIVSRPCLGPGSRPGQDCGEAVLMRASALAEHPPLCSRHESMAPQFVLTEKGSKGESASRTPADVTRHWQRVSVTQ